MLRTTRLVVEGFDHLYYILVRRQDVQGLYFFQLFNFLERVELFFHALDSHVLARLEGEGREDHRERTTPLLEL